MSIIDLIDNALRDYTSNDAMRWAPHPQPPTHPDSLAAAHVTPGPDLDVRHNAFHREVICTWLRTNGIDPGDVPMDARAHVMNNVLYIEMWDRPNMGRSWTYIALLHEPTPLVRRWLEGARAPEAADPTVHACRRMPTRRCPASYNAVCGDRPCARFESEDETPWL